MALHQKGNYTWSIKVHIIMFFVLPAVRLVTVIGVKDSVCKALSAIGSKIQQVSLLTLMYCLDLQV